MARQRIKFEDQKVHVALVMPVGMARQVDAIADAELTSRAHILRRAVAFYLASRTHEVVTQTPHDAVVTA